MSFDSLPPGRNLPSGWKWVKLGELISGFQPGFACGERDPNGVVQVRMNNVTTGGSFNWEELIRVPPNYTNMDKYWIKADDVLFNNTNSAELVGKSAIFSDFEEQVVFSNHFSRLRPNLELLDAGFLAKWLNLNWQQGLFSEICNRWVGQAAVPKQKLLQLNIPLPPLAEQKRIVSILNEQLAAVERARKAAEERIEAARALREAILRETYNGQATDGWKWANLSRIALINPPRQRDIPYSPDTPVTFVPMPSLCGDTGTIAWPEIRPLAEVSKGYTYFEEGDVLFAKITPCMQNGKHAIAYDLANGFGFGTTEFHVIRPGENVTADWIHRFIRQPSVLDEAARHFRGAVGQQRVPKEFLMDLPIPLPPIAEQKRIVSILNEQLGSVERARKASEEQLANIEAIPPAILRRAFSGEI